MLLNASLIVGPVQMTLASVMPSKENSSHNHSFMNKNIRRCKHSGSSSHSHGKNIHSSMKSMHPSSHAMKMIMVGKTMKMENNEHDEHACQCSSLCADCCGGHATVALLEFEFYQFIKPDSSQAVNKIIHYTPVFLPIEIPPPLT